MYKKDIPYLRQGDEVYICAPAKKVEKQIIDFAIKTIAEQGFIPVVSTNIEGEHFYFSGTFNERLSDLQAGLDHPTAKAIFCARGGYGIIQQLNHLKWEKFTKNPKWIVGFSDVTNLQMELGSLHFPSLHATMALNFAENTPATLHTMWQALQGENYTITAAKNDFNSIGNCEAPIAGGNLSIVYSLLSRTSPEFFKNKILFLEDVGESLYHFDRMIHVLEFHGIFDQIVGLMIGSFTDIKDDASVFGQSIEEIILRPVMAKGIPVGFGFPIGHQEDNHALPFEVTAKFSVTENGSSVHLF